MWVAAIHIADCILLIADGFCFFQDWDNSVVTTEELTSSYLDRWRKVREAWNLQSRHYSQRYEGSRRVLEAIAKK